MLEALGIAVGVFLLFVAGVMLFRFVFDRPRWDKAMNDARERGAKVKAAREAKLQASEERRSQWLASVDAKFEQIRTGAKDRYDSQLEAHAEAKKARGQSSPNVPLPPRRTVSKRRPPHPSHVDPLLDNLVAGAAAAALMQDLESAVDPTNGEPPDQLGEDPPGDSPGGTEWND